MMKAERVNVSSLAPDPANVRKHDKRNVESIVASLKKFGQQKPIVVGKDDVVVAGNGTLEAAKAIGWKEVDVVRTALTGAEAIAYAIADNRTSELADWDEETLADVLSALRKDESIDHLVTGFSDDEIDDLIASLEPEPEITEDDIPDPPKNPITKTGDLWIMGRHRLLCGDAAEGSDVARILDGERPDLCLTDPPYGVDLDYATHDDGDVDAYWALMDAWMKKARAFCDLIVCTVGYRYYGEWFKRYDPDSCGFWFNPMKQSLHPSAHLCKTEIVLIFGTVPEKWAWDTWEVNSDRGDGMRELHPCPKPVGLMAEIMKPKPYQMIFDPFLGSGTTLIAAEGMGRRCHGIEIAAEYCDVIVERWENLTGEKAKRA